MMERKGGPNEYQRWRDWLGWKERERERPKTCGLEKAGET
jgi:hypothetical protein